MKKILLAILVLGPLVTIAQEYSDFVHDVDTIFLTNGQKIICTITETKYPPIYYQKFENNKTKNASVKRKDYSRYAYGTPKEFAFSDSIDIQGQKKEAIYEIVESWFTNSDKNITKKILFKSSSLGIIKGSFTAIYKDNGMEFKDNWVTGTISFDVVVTINNEKCSYVFSNYVHTGNENISGTEPLSFDKLTNDVLGYDKFEGVTATWQISKWVSIKKCAVSQTKVLISELNAMIQLAKDIKK